MENKSNKVIDVIIEFINAVKSGNDAVIDIENGREYKIKSAKYILGQIIRQYELLPENYYISEKAKTLWEKLSSKNIWDYSHRNCVWCENDLPVTISEYTGGSKTPRGEREVKTGDSFVFRDVFHDEHMIPVSVIINELTALPKLDSVAVKKILDNVCVCRMLKDEDRVLPLKYKRPFDLTKVISMYKESGIIIDRK